MKKPTASQYELAYVVISQSQKKLQLPFFSRVTLRNAHDLATSLGHKVTLTSVPVE